MSADVEKPVDRHRDALETLANSDLDLQLVEHAQALLADADAEDGGSA